ncbi:hypothetical protein F2P81_012483 [Scophthalmus maximus]|uniref:Uncharacterized protein n=1 Tax=Scophthalmus maximus TaxID=52904 RepID=A0A6A4SQ87_SCOMX|nr:hypothetical protein F2P81_012483 [Scophthalmus maximus]
MLWMREGHKTRDMLTRMSNDQKAETLQKLITPTSLSKSPEWLHLQSINFNFSLPSSFSHPVSGSVSRQQDKGGNHHDDDDDDDDNDSA